MLEFPTDTFRGNDRADLLEAVTQLEQTSAEASGRTKDRIVTRCRVMMRPGDSSGRARPALEAASLDISSTGCRLIAPMPFGVGDIYWLEFARDTFDIPPIFARCLRCRLVREDAFEGGFAFFQAVVLPGFQDDELSSLL